MVVIPADFEADTTEPLTMEPRKVTFPLSMVFEIPKNLLF